MNFKNELIKNIYFKGINALLAFVTTVLLVRLLGTEGNGFYSLFIANSAVIALLVTFGLHSGVTYYAAKKEFSPETIINSFVWVLIVQAVIILAAEKIFESFFGISFFSDSKIPGLTFWGCLYLEAVFLSGYVTAVFTGYKWFDTINILSIITNAIFIFVFGYLLFENNPHGFANTFFVLKAYILLIVFQALFTFAILLKKVNYKPQFSFLSLQQVKKIFTYAGIAFFCNFFQFLAYRMDYWFINYFWNKEELGLYALASKLNQVLWMVPITMAAVIVPFAVTSSREVMEKTKTITRLMFSAYVLLGIGIAIASPFFIPLIFGNSFQGTIAPFLILLPGVIIFSLTTLLAAYFAGVNRQFINLKISFFCFAIILILDYILVPAFGIKGAAAASCIGYSASGFFSLYEFSAQSGSGFKELLFATKEDVIKLKDMVRQKFIAHG